MPPKKRKGLQRLLKGKKPGPAGLHRASVDPIRRAALLNESQRNLNVLAAVSAAAAASCSGMDHWASITCHLHCWHTATGLRSHWLGRQNKPHQLRSAWRAAVMS